jgi:hypothetical protein
VTRTLPVEFIPFREIRSAARSSADVHPALPDRHGPNLPIALVPDLDRDVPLAEPAPPDSLDVNVRVSGRDVPA